MDKSELISNILNATATGQAVLIARGENGIEILDTHALTETSIRALIDSGDKVAIAVADNPHEVVNTLRDKPSLTINNIPRTYIAPAKSGKQSRRERRKQERKTLKRK